MTEALLPRAEARRQELLAAGYGDISVYVIATSILLEEMSDEEYEAHERAWLNAPIPTI